MVSSFNPRFPNKNHPMTQAFPSHDVFFQHATAGRSLQKTGHGTAETPGFAAANQCWSPCKGVQVAQHGALGSWSWMVMEKPTWTIWGYHHFRKPPYLFIKFYYIVSSRYVIGLSLFIVPNMCLVYDMLIIVICLSYIIFLQ